jgi:hypothetical protein
MIQLDVLGIHREQRESTHEPGVEFLKNSYRNTKDRLWDPCIFQDVQLPLKYIVEGHEPS